MTWVSDLNYFYLLQVNDTTLLCLKGMENRIAKSHTFWISYKSIFEVIFPILNSLFFHHGYQSEISAVRIFKNTTLFSKLSNVQKKKKNPFSAWRMEISVKMGKITSPHPHKNHSSKHDQQAANGAKSSLLFIHLL